MTIPKSKQQRYADQDSGREKDVLDNHMYLHFGFWIPFTHWQDRDYELNKYYQVEKTYNGQE